MRIDRADHVATAVQVKHRTSGVGTRRRDPFRLDAARIHRLAFDVGGDGKQRGHLLEIRARLLDRRMARDRLRLEHLDDLLELLLRHRFTSPKSIADRGNASALRWRPDYSAAPRESAKAATITGVCRFPSRSSTVGTRAATAR